MKGHITGEQILKYAAGFVSAKDTTAIEKHIAGCEVCLLKVTHAFYKLKTACDKAEGFLRKYHERKLDQQGTDFVKQHLLICDRCLEKYRQLVEDIECSKSEILVKDVYRLTGQPSAVPATTSKSGLTKDWSWLPPGKDYFEFDKKGLSIGVADAGQGRLLIHLRSDKYDVSGVTVSLGKATKEGFDPLLSAVTTPKGIARLGKVEESPADKKDKYSLYISGLKKKDK